MVTKRGDALSPFTSGRKHRHTALLLEYVCASGGPSSIAVLPWRRATLGVMLASALLGIRLDPRVFASACVAGPGLAACPGAAGLCLAGLIA